MENDSFETLIQKKKEHSNSLKSINFLIEINEFKKSIKLIRKLRKNTRFLDKNFFYTYALYSYGIHNYTKAISILEKLEKKYGFFEEAHNLLIESLILCERHQTAKKIILTNKTSFINFYSLGKIYLELGDFRKAKKYFFKSIDIKKDHAPSHYQISRIRKYNKKDKYVNTLKKLLEKSNLIDKPFYYFSIAKYYQDLKDFKSSLFYLQKGNVLRKKNLTRFKITDFIKNSRFRRKLIFSNKQKISCSNTNIFIVGMPRTGSTLIECIFSTNPIIKSGGETSILDRCILRQQSVKGGELKSNVLNINYNRFFINPNKKTILTDKTLFNFVNIPVIINSFSNSKIIEILRDRDEVIWSIYKNNFDSPIMNFSYCLKDIEKFYSYYEKLMKYYKQKYSNRILSIRYEKFIENPREESKKIYNYCGLKWDNSFLNFKDKKIIIKTSSNSQLRSKIYNKPQENFKKYKELI